MLKRNEVVQTWLSYQETQYSPEQVEQILNVCDDRPRLEYAL